MKQILRVGLLTVGMLFFGGERAHAGAVLEWSELEDAGRFFLRQDFAIEGGLEFKAGQEFHLVALNGIAGIPMIYAEAYALDCADMSVETDEVTLVRPEYPEDPSGRDRSVAVDLKPGCHVGIYIEAADYYSPSLFELK